MIPITQINEKEKFFINKGKNKAYFLKVQKKLSGQQSLFYEINLDLDLEKIVKSKTKKIDVYLTPPESNIVLNNADNLQTTVNRSSVNSISRIMSSYSANLMSHLVSFNSIKKSYITSINPIKFVDLERYKNNFKGTSNDKFGAISSISTYVIQKNNDNDPEAGLPSTIQSRKQVYLEVEKGLFEGKPISSVIDFKEIKKRKAINKHRIDKNFQKYNKEIKEKIENLLPEVMRSKQFQQRSKTRKNSSSLRTCSFILEISEKDYLRNLQSDFNIVFVAKDKNDVNLDMTFVRVNLLKDLFYSSLPSFNDFEISYSNNTISISNNSKQLVSFLLYNKCIKKDKPFYENYYEPKSVINILPNKNSAKFKLSTFVPRNNSTSNESVQVTSFNLPNFFRLTPRFYNAYDSFEFDNMIEVGVPPQSNYNNTYVPFCVLNEQKKGKTCGKILIDISKIPKKYRKLKVIKKDLNRSLFGKIEKEIFNFNLEKVGFIRTGKEFKNIKTKPFYDSSNETSEYAYENNFLTIYDFNVENDKVYDYRLELVEDLKTVNRSISTSFFQEKIESKDNIVSIASPESSNTRTGDSVSLSFVVKIKESDAEKVFKSLLGNKYDLFKDILEEIKDISTNAVSIKLEKICIEDCTIETIDYLSSDDLSQGQSEEANTDSNKQRYSYVDSNIDKNKSYIYKLTPCIKPVSELTAGINEEIFRRSASPKNIFKNFKQFKYAGIKRKLSNLDTSILYNLANKISGIKRGKIIDSETSAGLSQENMFSLASTGDVKHIYMFKKENLKQNEKGFINFEAKNTEVYRKKDIKDTGSHSTINYKIISSFQCEFEDTIDYCSIFLQNNSIIEHVCNIHIDKEKENFKFLIETTNCTGKVDILMTPIGVDGKVYQMSKITSVNL